MLLRRAGLTASAGLSCYKKMVENCRRQHCQLTRARNAYARQYRRQHTVRQRLRNLCINKNKMVV